MAEKPKAFSDPYHDWDGYDDLFQKIIQADPKALVANDYRVIFARHLPAADYQEGVYYLPYCFEYLRNSKLVHDSAYPDSLMWWLRNFQNELKADKLWDKCLESLFSVTRDLMGNFQLFDLSEEECNKIGRSFDYSVGPYNQQTVSDIWDDITIWPEFYDLLEQLTKWISNFEYPERARWYVESAFHSRSWCLLYEEKCELENYEKKEEIFHRLHAFKLLNKAQSIAMDLSANEGHFKYNGLVLL